MLRKILSGLLALCLTALASGCASRGYGSGDYQEPSYVDAAEIVARHTTGVPYAIADGLATYGTFGLDQWELLDTVLWELNH